MIYSTDASFACYYDFHFPSSVELAPSDIYTPSKSKPEKEYVTIDVIDVENLIDFDEDELNTIPDQISVELIDYNTDDITLDEFYDDCFSINDLIDVPSPLNLPNEFIFPDYTPLDELDLTPLDKLKKALDNLGAWARSA